MKKSVLASAFAFGLALTPAVKAITVTSAVGGAPTGVKHLNFDDLSNGASGALVSSGPDGPVNLQISPNARVAVGAVSGQFAAPFLSGNNGLGFASQAGPGADTTPYLTSGRIADGGSVKVTFGSDQQYLGLLWGSVDNYNTLQMFDVNNILVGTVTGSDVTGSPTGDQGINGTHYVNITDVAPFRYFVASSSQFAFEFDNVAYNEKPVCTPDGGSLSGIFAGVAALMAYAHRRQARRS